MFETQPTIIPEPTPLSSPNINSLSLPSIITSEKCIVSSIPNVAPQDATATSCSPEKSLHQSNLNFPETDHPTSSPIDQSVSPEHSNSPTNIQRQPVTTNIHPMQTQGKSGITKPKVFSAIATDVVPVTTKEALKHIEWKKVMQTEYDALLKNKTWTLVELPPNAHVIGCKWIFKNKYNSDDILERRKARLVARGYNQVVGIDYSETFSPMVKPTTVRVVLSVVVAAKWQVRQLDVNNAFLHGELTETVYMDQPPGFSTNPKLVCRLHKAIYGLKQAPRAWYHKLSTMLIKMGFRSTISDSSLFTKITANSIILILIYVDDILITGIDTNAITALVAALNMQFSLKDLGSLHYFLGIEAIWSSNGALHLTQTKYIKEILSKVQMTNANSLPSPMVSSLKLTADAFTAFHDPTLYHQMAGALQYLTFTRPDISYVANKLCQYMHQPQTHHWNAMKRLLRYLAGTPTHGLLYTPNTHPSTSFHRCRLGVRS